MNIEDIVNYVSKSPENSNPNVLRGMLGTIVESASVPELCHMTIVIDGSTIEEDAFLDMSFVSYNTVSQTYTSISARLVNYENSLGVYLPAVNSTMASSLYQPSVVTNSVMYIYKDVTNQTQSVTVTGDATLVSDPFSWRINVNGDFSLQVTAQPKNVVND